MASPLQDFRDTYPQYNDWDDEDLAKGLHQKFYSDMDFEVFREKAGLPPLEPVEPPSITDRITNFLGIGDDKPEAVLKDDIPLSAELPTPPTPPEEQKSSLTDIFRSGWDQYLAARATKASVKAASDISGARDIVKGVDLGESDSAPIQSVQTVPGGPSAGGLRFIMRLRADAAEAGSVEAQAAIEADVALLRAKAVQRLQNAIDERQRVLARTADVKPSEGTQRLLQAQTASEAVGAFVDDPITIAMEITAQSLPNMADSIVLAAGAGLVAGPFGVAAGMGIGSASSEQRSAFAEGLVAEGVDLNDADSILSAVENPEMIQRVVEHANTRATIIGALDAASAGIAGKTLVPFVKNTVARTISNTMAQAAVQATLGAAGEAGAQLATEGEIQRPGEVLAEAVGEGPTSVVEVGLASVSGLRRQVAENEVNRITKRLEEAFVDPTETREGAEVQEARVPTDRGLASARVETVDDRQVLRVGSENVRPLTEDAFIVRVGNENFTFGDEDAAVESLAAPEVERAWAESALGQQMGLTVEEARHGIEGRSRWAQARFQQFAQNVEGYNEFVDRELAKIQKEFPDSTLEEMAPIFNQDWAQRVSDKATAFLERAQNRASEAAYKEMQNWGYSNDPEGWQDVLEVAGAEQVDLRGIPGIPDSELLGAGVDPRAVDPDLGEAAVPEGFTPEQVKSYLEMLEWGINPEVAEEGVRAFVSDEVEARGDEGILEMRTPRRRPRATARPQAQVDPGAIAPRVELNRVHNPDGSAYTEFPDGTRFYEFPDGTQYYERPDGTRFIERPEGLFHYQPRPVEDPRYSDVPSEQLFDPEILDFEEPEMRDLEPEEGTISSPIIDVEATAPGPIIDVGATAPSRPSVTIDVPDLGRIRSQLGEDAEVATISAVKDALNQRGVTHRFQKKKGTISVEADSRAEADAAVDLAQSVLETQAVSSPMGEMDGIRIERTKAEGRRGRTPDPKIQDSRRPVLDMMGGSNYVAPIGMVGRLPLDPNNNYRLGDGRLVQVPKTPVRREHILARMEKAFGLKIYQGRVKGPKTRLGFFRKQHGEVRVRNMNDIETAAHEIAHWVDDRNNWVHKFYEKFSGELRAVSYDTASLQEGFAEFMRLYLTQDHEAMARAPSFYDAWRKEVAKRDPDMAKMLDDIQEMAHAWMIQGARARLESKITSAVTSFVEKVRSLYPKQGFLQSALDGLRGIKMAELDLTDNATTEAYEKLRLAVGGANGVLEAAFFYGTPGWREDNQGLRFSGESLRDIFGSLWGNEDLALYMVARRAQELAGQGRENLVRADEIAAGLRLGNQNPEFARMFDRFQAFNTRMLDFAEGAGILSPDTRQTIEEANQNYVPFNRVVESHVSGQQVRQGGNPFQRLTGGTSNLNNIWENIVNNNGLMIRAAMVNDAKRTLYQKIAGAKNQRGGLYASPIEADRRRVRVSSESVLRKLVEAMGMTWQQYQAAKVMPSNTQEAATIQTIDRMRAGTEDFLDLFSGTTDPRGNVDFYMDAGEKKFMEIADPALWDSIQYLGPKGTNLVLSIFGGFSAALRRGVTATPVFQLKNFVRDTANAWLLSKQVHVPAVRALGVVTSRLSKDPAYQEMMLNGGGFANRSQGLQQERHLVVDPRRAAAVYDRFMSRFENANRLAEYKAATERGETPRRAALLSREISTDFAMRGSSDVMRSLAIMVPFLNARLQGLYQIGRQFTSADAAVSYAVRGAALATATIALYMMNKDDERYEELPEDIKDLYWVYYFGEREDDYFLVPKPFESGMMFGTVPERMFELIEERDGKEFADAMGWMFLQTFSLDVTPQAFQPELELQRNKSFTGAPIIPMYLENVEASEQYRYYTSRTAREAGRKLGLSPIKFEHRVRGYLGTMGTYMLAASDAAIRNTAGPIETEGERPTRGETWRESLIVRGLADPIFTEGPPRRTKFTADLYEMVREVEKVANSTKLMHDRRNAELEEYLEDPENARMFAANAIIQDVRSKMRDIRVNMDKVRTHPGLTGDQKRVQLWELQRGLNELAREATAELRTALGDGNAQ